jgi:hypothetical protein
LVKFKNDFFHHKFTMATKHITLALAAVIFAGCAYETPIQRYSESRSKFRTPPVLMSHNIPDKDIYRIFQQGATGFVPISAIRSDLEAQAEKFCERQGKVMFPLGSSISHPPYILGNFPRMELVFACVDKARS